VRVSQAYSTLVPLTLALSREGRGKRIKVKGVNAFVLVCWINCIKLKELDQAIFLYEKVVSRPSKRSPKGIDPAQKMFEKGGLDTFPQKCGMSNENYLETRGLLPLILKNRFPYQYEDYN
jgi:hypothetical protein